MSKELAVSHRMTFSRSLTDIEQHFVDCLHEQRIHEMPDGDFRKLIVQACILNGVKDLPSDLEVNLLFDVVTDEFREVGSKAWLTAFKWNAIGKEWERKEHFNSFSIQYMSDVLLAYREYKQKHWKNINSAIRYEALPPAQTDYDPLQILEAHVELARKKQWTVIEITGAINARELFKRGYYTKDMWSDEQWNAWREKAEKLTQYEWRENRKRRQFDEEGFTFAVNQKIGDYVYKSILDSKLAL